MVNQLIQFGTPYKPETEQSVYNTRLVLHAVAQRFPQWAPEARPYVNVLTLRAWNQRGFRVKKGEKAIRVMTKIPITRKNEKGEQEIVAERRAVAYVFALPQVEPFRLTNINAPSNASGAALPGSNGKAIPSSGGCTSGTSGTTSATSMR